MDDERFKEEMIRMMGTVILKLDILDNRVSNVENSVSTLKSDVSTLKSDVSKIKAIQKEQTVILKRIDSKSDSIAEKVLNHEIRIKKAEQNIEDLRGGVH